MTNSSDAGGRNQTVVKEAGSQVSMGATVEVTPYQNQGVITFAHTANSHYLNRLFMKIDALGAGMTEVYDAIIYDGHPTTGDTLTPTGAHVLQGRVMPADGWKMGGVKFSNGVVGYDINQSTGGTFTAYLTLEYDFE